MKLTTKLLRKIINDSLLEGKLESDYGNSLKRAMREIRGAIDNLKAIVENEDDQSVVDLERAYQIVYTLYYGLDPIDR